jgi:hypothetical protein
LPKGLLKRGFCIENRQTRCDLSFATAAAPIGRRVEINQ